MAPSATVVTEPSGQFVQAAVPSSGLYVFLPHFTQLPLNL